MQSIQIEDDVILWLYEDGRKVLFWDACAFRPSMKLSLQNKRYEAELQFVQKNIEGVGTVFLPHTITCGGIKFKNIRIS